MGSFERVSPSIHRNRECQPCQACTAGQTYRTPDTCTGSALPAGVASTEVCLPCTSCNSLLEYADVSSFAVPPQPLFCGADRNTQCRPTTACIPGDMALGRETRAATATSNRECGALPSTDWTETRLFAAATRNGRLGVVGAFTLRQVALAAVFDTAGNPDEVRGKEHSWAARA